MPGIPWLRCLLVVVLAPACVPGAMLGGVLAAAPAEPRDPPVASAEPLDTRQRGPAERVGIDATHTTASADPGERKERGTLERIKIEAAEGMFVLYDATGPEAVRGDRTGRFAYWRFLDEEDIYIYHRPLFSQLDVGLALLDLERELGVDIEAIAKTHASFQRALALAGDRDRWDEPASVSANDDTFPDAGDDVDVALPDMRDVGDDPVADMADADERRWDLLTEGRLRKVARLPRGREVSPLVGAHPRAFPWPPPLEDCLPPAAKAIDLPPPEKPCRDLVRVDPIDIAVSVVKRCGGCGYSPCPSNLCRDDPDPCIVMPVRSSRAG